MKWAGGCPVVAGSVMFRTIFILPLCTLENRGKPGRFAYSSMKAAPIIMVGKIAQRNNFTAEIPSSPNRETKID
jgi:hypothetical protein